MSYETSEFWKNNKRVKIGDLRKGQACIDIQGRTLTIGHTHNGTCVFAVDNVGIDVCYAANAEVVPCQPQ